MIFANIEYLFLLILLIPYIVWYVMRRKRTEYSSGIYHTNVSECTEKLESLFDSCPFSAQAVYVCYDSIGSCKTANY